MIVEERIYTLYHGTVPDYLAAYEKEGFAIQKEHLGNLVGYFSTDIGPLNQIVHMWAYRDLADRNARRKKLQADPRWQTYRKKVAPFIQHQENKILVPAPFSPYAEER
jgi:hypothetical protein